MITILGVQRADVALFCGTGNGKKAKASLNVKVGDVIEIAFGDKRVKVEVLSIEETYKKEEAKELYKVL